MEIRYNQIPFQARIELISQDIFDEKVNSLNPKKHYVGWPWTADTLKVGKNLYTDKDTDCIVVAIKDGSKYKLAHLGIYNQKKARNNGQKGFDIENVKRRLLDGINMGNEDLHAYIMGGFQYNKKKTRLIKEIFEAQKIPYTIFATRKDVHYYGTYSYFFSNKDDTLYITNSLTNSGALQWDRNLPRPKEVSIIKSPKGTKVVYNTYTKADKGYDFKRKLGTAEDFLNDQFEEVKLSKYDYFA